MIALLMLIKSTVKLYLFGNSSCFFSQIILLFIVRARPLYSVFAVPRRLVVAFYAPYGMSPFRTISGDKRESVTSILSPNTPGGVQ